MCQSHLEDYILNLYHVNNIRTPEQLNIKMISKALDIKFFYWEHTSQAIIYDDMNAIFIDSRIRAQLQWQDFCHELGHLLLHVGDQINMPPLFQEYQEWKANNFMYHACVPTFMLDSLEIKDMTTYNIHKIQTLFNVEYEFAQQRLNQYITNKISSLKWNGVL